MYCYFRVAADSITRRGVGGALRLGNITLSTNADDGGVSKKKKKRRIIIYFLLNTLNKYIYIHQERFQLKKIKKLSRLM